MINIGLHFDYFAQLARSYIRIKLRVKITIHESIRKAHPHLHGRAVPFLFLIQEHQDRIHMPRGFVDDPEGDVADEEVNDGGF